MTSARILLLCAVSSLVGLSSGLWLGGDEKDTLGVGSRPSQQGFERNADVYSHLIIPPWSRPFKIGYCKSWEWSTDKRWRDTRLDICENYGKGGRKAFILRSERHCALHCRLPSLLMIYIPQQAILDRSGSVNFAPSLVFLMKLFYGKSFPKASVTISSTSSLKFGVLNERSNHLDPRDATCHTYQDSPDDSGL